MTEQTHEPDSIVEFEQPPATPYESHTAITAIRIRTALEQRLAGLRADWRKTWMDARDTPIQRVLRMLDALEWPEGFIYTIEGEEVACIIIRGKVRTAMFGDVHFEKDSVALCSNGRVSQVGQSSWASSFGSPPLKPSFSDPGRFAEDIVALEQRLLKVLLA